MAQINSDCNFALCQLISERIAASPHQRITFAEYMDLVLYHPQHGYYATGAVNIGAQGDFFTSPHLGADFGELLAEQFVQMWDILGRPTPFTLVEMGAGQGLLAADVLGYLQKHYLDFFNVLEYVIVEKAAGLIAQQQQMLRNWATGWGRLYWRTLEEIPSASITGCCFSNELVDALPVHQFAIEGGQLREVYVTTDLVGAGLEDNMSTTQITPEHNPPSPKIVGAGLEDNISTTQIPSQQNPPSPEIVGAGLEDNLSTTQIPSQQNPPSPEIVGAGLEDNTSTTQIPSQQNPPSPEIVGAGLEDNISTTQIPFEQNPPSPQKQEIRFQEVTGEPSTPKLAEYFNLVGINLSSGAYADGYRSEVNLAALDWLSAVADRMQLGYLLTIDYGYPSFRYYNPARSQGTLQCYYRHSHHSDPYVHVGHQDITAHVDFTALERQGELCGLQTVGFTKQGLFLMALGMGDRIAALSNTNVTDAQGIQQVLRRRDALHQLIEPQGLGGFGVLVQSKGLREEENGRSLQGLFESLIGISTQPSPPQSVKPL